MKKIGWTLLALAPFFMGSCASDMTLKSPDGSVQVVLTEHDGALAYTVRKSGKTILEPSKLGLMLADADFSRLELVNIGNGVLLSDSYATPGGKKQQNEYEAYRWEVTAQNAAGEAVVVSFHVADDGIAFRYSFPEPFSGQKVIEGEVTSFRFPGGTQAWLHPHDNAKTGWAETCPSYEENYYVDIPVGTPAPLEAGWSFPALFHVGNHWALITEAGLEPPYCGTRLAQNSPDGEYRITFAQPGENPSWEDAVLPEFEAGQSVTTPWRVILVGGLADLVESTMVTDLAEPSRTKETGWIHPGIAAWSWGVEKDESMNYDRQKRYIDYAADMGWEYMLVDALWDAAFGYEGLQELIDYAAGKNVKLLLWYNSAGEWNSTYQTPRSVLVDRDSRRREFERVSRMGVAGLKVDFWPGDGPASIQYYYDLMADAAQYNLLLNFHWTTVHRGWERTFPHLMTMESVKGFEFTTFEQANQDKAPEQCAIVVFSRNVVGPMDYTPVRFGDIPGIERRTRNGFEIALTVLFQSGIQHFVETPESMAEQPDYVQAWMRDLPRAWDEVRLIDGFPGKYAVFARRAGETWYVAGINAENQPKSLTLDLSALETGGRGVMITDGATEREFSREEVELKRGKMTVELQPAGGFVLVF